MKKAVWPVLFLFLLLALGLLLTSQNTRAGDSGLKVFVEKRCYACHTIDVYAQKLKEEREAFAKAKGVELKDTDDGDDGAKKGGDLSDVGKKHDAEWLRKFVKNPKGYFKDEAKCRRNAKKKYRKRFKGTDEEYEVLIAYLSTLKQESQKKEGFESCLKEQ